MDSTSPPAPAPPPANGGNRPLSLSFICRCNASIVVTLIVRKGPLFCSRRGGRGLGFGRRRWGLDSRTLKIGTYASNRSRLRCRYARSSVAAVRVDGSSLILTAPGVGEAFFFCSLLPTSWDTKSSNLQLNLYVHFLFLNKLVIRSGN